MIKRREKESLHHFIERVDREWTGVARFARYAAKRARHFNKIGEEEALWIKTHPKADPDLIAKHQRNKRRVNRKERWWRRRRNFSDRRKARLGNLLKILRRRWRKRRNRRWRRAPIRWNGNPQNVTRRVKLVIRFSQNRKGFNATVTSTTGGQHSATSWHYDGRAVDEVEEEMVRLQNALLDQFGPEFFLELFGPAEWYVKNGTVYYGVSFPHHEDHEHAAA